MVKTYQATDKKEGVVRTAVLTFIFFLYLYSFQVPGLPFGTVMPILGLMAAYTAFEFFRAQGNTGGKYTSKMVCKYWLWNFFLILYVFMLNEAFGVGNGTSPIKDYIQMLIILPIFYLFGNTIFRGVEELMKILYIGVIVQSIIIIVALFVPALSLGLFLLFPEGSYNTDTVGGLDLAMQQGYHVGLGVFSSAGCIKMAIGQIGACYYLIKSRGKSLFFHTIFFLMITIATSVIARTGLLISIIGICAVFLAKRKQGGKRALGFVFLFMFTLFIGYFVVTDLFSMNILEGFFQRYIMTSDIGIHDSYFRGYLGEGGDNIIPPIGYNTLIGLGITYGTSGAGITTITDGGLMRNYSAMGLIMAIINYLIIALFFLKSYKRSKTLDYKKIILFMGLLLLIGEFKEYYIYSIYPMCFIFLILSLIERSEMDSSVTWGGAM